MGKLHNDLMGKGGVYAKWHQQKYQQFIQWLVLILVAAVIGMLLIDRANKGSYGVQSEAAGEVQGSDDNFSQLPELTRQMLDLAREIRHASPEEKSALLEQLRALAQSRQSLFSQAITQNPRAALNNTLNASLRAQMPAEIRSLVEEKKTVRGKYSHLIFENDETGISKEELSVKEQGTGKRYMVSIAGNNSSALSDDSVSITGVVLGDTMATTTQDVQVIAAADVTPTTVKKLAVIMVNFADDPSQPWTKEQVRGYVFTGSGSVSNFWKENSFGQWAIEGRDNTGGAIGDIYGWYNLSMLKANCDSTSTMQSQADAAVVAAGGSLTGYTHIMYVFPSCALGYTGWGMIGGSPARTWINGSISSRTPAHEIGHNFGMYHARTYLCKTTPITIPVSIASCYGEYGDPFSVMGQSGVKKHVHNYHKDFTSTTLPNWIDSANELTLSRSANPDGTYTLYPIEQAASGLQVIRVPGQIDAAGVVQGYYYLEFRQPFGIDNFGASDPVVKGVTVRYASPNTSSTRENYIVDTTPSTSSFTDAPLLAGQTFYDTAKGITINTVSVSTTSATVRVSFGPLPCIPTNPSISITPTSKSGYPGSTQSYNVTVTNNDTATCSGSSYVVTPTLQSGFLQSPSTHTTAILAPASVETFTVNITAPDTASTGSYNFSEKAVNTSNNSLSATASATFNVTAPDTTAPVVSISKPRDGSKIGAKGNFQINASASASASDASGIASITLSLDGTVVQTCPAVTSCSYTTLASTISSGTHTIVATATDNSPAANSGSKSVTATK